MYGSRIVTGLAVVFAGMAALFAVLAFFYSPAFLVMAAVFGVAGYLTWYHASGRLLRGLYRGVERQADPDDAGGFGAGPREEWTPPREEQRRRARAQANVAGRGRRSRTRSAGNSGSRERRRGGRPPSHDGPTAREAYRTLNLDPDADEAAVRDAYRERVKEVHPDRPSGDEEEFKAVKAAYERLSDD
ncbi:MAG: J domain-containing protein [Haloarculaceae archaeon]